MENVLWSGTAPALMLFLFDLMKLPIADFPTFLA